MYNRKWTPEVNFNNWAKNNTFIDFNLTISSSHTMFSSSQLNSYWGETRYLSRTKPLCINVPKLMYTLHNTSTKPLCLLWLSVHFVWVHVLLGLISPLTWPFVNQKNHRNIRDHGVINWRKMKLVAIEKA